MVIVIVILTCHCPLSMCEIRSGSPHQSFCFFVFHKSEPYFSEPKSGPTLPSQLAAPSASRPWPGKRHRWPWLGLPPGPPPAGALTSSRSFPGSWQLTASSSVSHSALTLPGGDTSPGVDMQVLFPMLKSSPRTQFQEAGSRAPSPSGAPDIPSLPLQPLAPWPASPFLSLPLFSPLPSSLAQPAVTGVCLPRVNRGPRSQLARYRDD